jgi:hypothetical protein
MVSFCGHQRDATLEPVYKTGSNGALIRDHSLEPTGLSLGCVQNPALVGLTVLVLVGSDNNRLLCWQWSWSSVSQYLATVAT